MCLFCGTCFAGRCHRDHFALIPHDVPRYPPGCPSALSPDPSTGALCQVMLCGLERRQPFVERMPAARETRRTGSTNTRHGAAASPPRGSRKHLRGPSVNSPTPPITHHTHHAGPKHFPLRQQPPMMCLPRGAARPKSADRPPSLQSARSHDRASGFFSTTTVGDRPWSSPAHFSQPQGTTVCLYDIMVLRHNPPGPTRRQTLQLPFLDRREELTRLRRLFTRRSRGLGPSLRPERIAAAIAYPAELAREITIVPLRGL